jgi:signal transduction histidine kinase
MVIESATDRILRILALSVALGSAIFTLLGAADIATQAPYLDHAYLTALFVIYLGVPIALGIVSFFASITVIRRVALLHGASELVFLALWVPSLDAGIPGDPVPFLLNLATIGTCTAAIALSYVGSWVYIVVVAAVCGLVRVSTFTGEPDFDLAFQDTVLAALFSAVMVTLIHLARVAGDLQDRTSLAARESAVAAREAEALERQRTKYHAFTHDDVLATLNAAVRDAPGTREATRATARHALDKMDGFAGDASVHDWVTADEVELLLREAAAAAGLEPEPADTSPARDLVVPVDAADALAEALAEAVRNSVHHAGWADGRAVRREIDIEFTSDGVRITVLDDGRGFAPSRVRPDRLGVRLSILQRLISLPGGDASVNSIRGRGTTVVLSWKSTVDA